MALRNVTSDQFTAAYRTHARSILIFLARRTYDPEVALDLTAETFAQAFEGRRRCRAATDEEVAAWLFGIARHVLSRSLRRGSAERRALTRLGVEVPSLEPEDLVRVVELAGLDELRGAVARELGALLNAKGGNEVSADTRALQVDVAPIGSRILEEHR